MGTVAFWTGSSICFLAALQGISDSVRDRCHVATLGYVLISSLAGLNVWMRVAA